MHIVNLTRLSQRTGRLSAFTLAEVVISVCVVALIFGGVLAGYVQSARRAEWSGYSLAAQALAIQQLEQARAAIWDLSLPKNEVTNLNLNGISYNASTLTWKGYSVATLDLPVTKNTNSTITTVTNFVTVTMLTNVSGVAGVSLQMVQVDTVFVFYAFKGKRLYTNTVAMYFAPDNRDPTTL